MSGHSGDTRNVSAREVARRFGVSERTARRHLANGSLPDERRTRGADGKTYPGSYRPKAHRVTVHRDAVMARNAIRRLARLPEFTDADAAEVETIAAEARRLAQRWANIVANSAEETG